MIKEVEDPEVAVILLDVVLGYGSHPDPAGEMVPVIEKARDLASKAGRDLAIVGFVCGTSADPQNLLRQETALRTAGVILAESSAQAVRMATTLASEAGAIGRVL